MSTTIRPELSRKNVYWISKDRYYELKHFCLQYKEWQQELRNLEKGLFPDGLRIEEVRCKWADPTAVIAMRRARVSSKKDLVEYTAYQADKEIDKYILKAVTEGRSYEYLKTHDQIPCSRSYFYERYRKFFWLLSKER